MAIRNHRELFHDINPMILSVIWRSLWNLSLSHILGNVAHIEYNILIHKFQSTWLIIMAALCNRTSHYIFALWSLLSLLCLLSPPSLTGRRLDVYHTTTHGAALMRIQNADLKCAAHGSLEIQDPKNRQKFAILVPSRKFFRLYLHN